jgi:hypothetical protein
MRDLTQRRRLATYGVHFAPTAVLAQDAWNGDVLLAADANPHLTDTAMRGALTALISHNGGPAMDAQPTLVSATNAGIPAFLTNIVDPEVIRILVTPMRAAQIFGETKKGDWTTLSAQFPTIESAGNVAAYGDYNNNGTTDASPAWVPRQSYHYQTIKRYGERQLAMWGAASINYSAELDRSAALIMNKFQNRSYFFGVVGLQNFGALNDPSLIAPITPSVKTAGGTAWTNATAQEIYNDVLALYGQLQAQMGFNIDMSDQITLVISNNRAPFLAKVSQFNVTARQTVMENFPNLKIETAPEYTTSGGELMQMILPNYEGVQTAYGAFTEKMRAHPLIAMLSAWEQKMSGGTWGMIIRRPTAIAQMLGI